MSFRRRAGDVRAGAVSLGSAAQPCRPPHSRMAHRLAARPRTINCREKQGEPSFRIVEEELVFKRYLTLYNRRVMFPGAAGRQEQEHEFDIVGHPQSDFQYAVVFPYHTSRTRGEAGEVTLIREYCQGPNEMMYVLPTGGFDPNRHPSLSACGQAELSEEVQLQGGRWVPLLPDHHPGIAEVKWCRNRFKPFLCIDPQPDHAPALRDAEEFIEVHRMKLDALHELMFSGDMLLPSVSTCCLALDKLKSLKYL